MAAPSQAPSRRTRLLTLAAFIALAACAFGPGLSGKLLSWDDDRFVTDDPIVQSVSWHNIQEIFSRPHQQAYHPLHLVGYLVQYALWGKWALGYKLVSLALYVVCVWLLLQFLLLLELDFWAAAAGAALFLVHPLHVEAVSWISAQKEPLSFIFLLLSLRAYLRVDERWWRSRAYWAAFALFGAALLTKTSTIVLPLLMVAIDVLRSRLSFKRSLARAAPFFVLAASVGIYVRTLWAANAMTRPDTSGLAARLSLVFSTLGHYYHKLVVPLDLSPVYAIHPPARPGSALVGVIVTVGLVALVVRSKLANVRLAAAWLLLALLPVCNIVPVYFYVQDRYAFIASAALAIGLAALASHVKARRAVLVTTGVAVVALAVTSSLAARHWRDDRQLWQRAARVQPRSYFAQLGLGHAYRAAGELADAKGAYKRAIALRPHHPAAKLSLCLADVAMKVAASRRQSRVSQVEQVLRGAWSNRAMLVRLSAKLLQAGTLACARVAEERAWSLRAPTALEAIRAASRWTIAGDGALALRALGYGREGLAKRYAAAYWEIRAQALVLLGRRKEAIVAFSRFRGLSGVSDDKLRQTIARLRGLHRSRLASFYEQQVTAARPN